MRECFYLIWFPCALIVRNKVMAATGDFSFANGGNGVVTPKGLARIQTQCRAGESKLENGICHDDSVPPVKAQTINELHSLQKKRSVPTTPIADGLQQGNAAFPFATISEEERRNLQLQSIRLISSLFSLFLSIVCYFWDCFS